MIKKINYRFALVFIVALLVFNLSPLFLLAQTPEPTGLVPCGTGEAGPADCQWEDLVALFNNVINFILFNLLVPLAVIAIVWSGIKILISQDQPAQLTKAKEALKKVGIGMFLALGAYAIVKTIVTLLAGEGSTFQETIELIFGSLIN